MIGPATRGAIPTIFALIWLSRVQRSVMYFGYNNQIICETDTSFLESQEAAPGRLSHRFRSAADIHLDEDRFTVRLHRPFCDKKGCRNLLIALSLCHQL